MVAADIWDSPKENEKRTERGKKSFYKLKILLLHTKYDRIKLKFIFNFNIITAVPLKSTLRWLLSTCGVMTTSVLSLEDRFITGTYF